MTEDFMSDLERLASVKAPFYPEHRADNTYPWGVIDSSNPPKLVCVVNSTQRHAQDAPQSAETVARKIADALTWAYRMDEARAVVEDEYAPQTPGQADQADKNL